MSGPIIRKYGFPNFDKIFGQETPKHGLVRGEETPYQTAEPIAPLAPEAPNQAGAPHPTRPTEPATNPNPDDPTGRATTAEVEPSTEFGNAVS